MFKSLHVYAGIKQLGKFMVMVRTRLLTVGVEIIVKKVETLHGNRLELETVWVHV